MRNWHETARETLRFGRAYLEYRRGASQPVGTPPGQVDASAKVFYDAMVQQVDWQVRAGDALDLKIATWFTLTTALLPVVAALLGAEHSRLTGHAGQVAIGCAVGGAVVWIVIVRVLYLAYLPNEWETGPKRCEFEKAARTREPQKLYLDVGKFIAIEAAPFNDAILTKKARRLSLGVRLFGLEFFFFGVAVTIGLLGLGSGWPSWLLRLFRWIAAFG